MDGGTLIAQPLRSVASFNWLVISLMLGFFLWNGDADWIIRIFLVELIVAGIL